MKKRRLENDRRIKGEKEEQGIVFGFRELLIGGRIAPHQTKRRSM